MIITYTREEPIPLIPDLSLEAPVEAVPTIASDSGRLGMDDLHSMKESMGSDRVILSSRVNPLCMSACGEATRVSPVRGMVSKFLDDPFGWIDKMKPKRRDDSDETETASFGVSPTLQSVLNICASRSHSFSDI